MGSFGKTNIMKIKSLILPVIVAMILIASVGYWVYEYKHFTVEPRVTGLDNRPAADPQDAAGQKPEGTMETFREVAFAAPGLQS